MQEIEVKIIAIDRDRVERRLRELGAVRTFDGEMLALYYDDPARSLSTAQDIIRLRREGDRSVLVFKKFVHDRGAKVRDEYEVTVSDFDAMRSILEGLGLSPWLRMRKHRVTWELEGTHIDIDKYVDEYDYIPVFLEIEAADVASVHRCAELLGFTAQDCRPWTVLDLAEHYAKK